MRGRRISKIEPWGRADRTLTSPPCAVDDRAGDRESQSGAASLAGALRVRAEEAVEDLVLLRLGDARPRVLDGQDDLGVGGVERQMDGSVGGGVLADVCEQVVDRLPQPVPVTRRRRVGAR